MTPPLERIESGTRDLTQENVAKILELFPNVGTEVQDDETGEVKRVVDFDALREQLGDVAEGMRERYQFTWPGKRAAKEEARRPISKTLRPVKERSKNWDDTQNLYIEGDNLDALKILRETYAGKIKMIYIDPPYNTGHDFVYHDNFAQGSGEYREGNGEYSEEGRLVANPESNGRFHSDWCSMMYPRLLLARDLLDSRGAIFVSIDDNEITAMLKLLEEVFGRENHVATIPRQSRASVQNDTDISSSHEYLILFAKKRRQDNRRLKESNATEWMQSSSFACYPKPSDQSRYSNPDNDPRGLWKADPFDAPNVRPNLTYVIENPSTGERHLPPIGRCWRTTPDQFKKLLADNRIIFGRKGEGRPQLKVFYEEKKLFGEVDNTWWDASRVSVNSIASKQLNKLFDGISVFDTPKPVDLIQNAMKLALPESSEDYVLDFFSGSAAAAHAVMQLNAEDGGNRRFIMVQLPEVCDEKSEAAKAGYHTICDIGEERIRRAGEKIKGEIEKANEQLELGAEPKRVPDIGFRVLRVDSSNYADVRRSPDEMTQDMLDGFVDVAKKDRKSLDKLFECFPTFQMPYDASIEVLDGKAFAGHTVYSVNGGQLVACFDADIPETVLRGMAALDPKPSYAVVSEAGLKNSQTVTNFAEIFRQSTNARAGATQIRII